MENWKPVVGYEGLYEVSDGGNVRSMYRGRNTGKVLAPGVRKHGRRYVALCKDGVIVHDAVARLVLKAFVGPPTAPMALHKDDDHSNDTVGNLYWGTQADNMEDKIANGGTSRGAKHHNATLTEGDVIDIRKQLAEGVSHHTLAAIYKVLPTAIQSIKHRRTWKWLN